MTQALKPRAAGRGRPQFTTTPLSEAVVEAQARQRVPVSGPTLESEFCRPDDCLRLFGLKKGFVYNLANNGRIRMISLRQKGNKRGVALVSVPSVRGYLNGLLEEQAPVAS